MRFLGLLATSVLLAVGATAVLTMVPDSEESVVPQAAPAATPDASAPSAGKKARKPRFTAAQRRARAAAVTALRDQGYRPVTLSDYDPEHVLRVLVGKGEGGQRAFFFAGGRYLGNDAAEDSESIEVARAGNRSAALAYRVFEEGDKACCPSGGKVRVLFRWDGKQLAPQTAIPPATARRPPLG
jgi:hypothetical protein